MRGEGRIDRVNLCLPLHYAHTLTASMEDDAASSSINAPAHDDESTWDEPFGEGMLSNAGGDQEEAGEWRSEVRPMDVRLAEQEDRLKASEDQLRVSY